MGFAKVLDLPWFYSWVMLKRKATHSNSGLENSMDWIVHGVAKSRTRLSDFHFTKRGLGGVHFPRRVCLQ